MPGESPVAPADVRDADAVEAGVERTVEEFGGVDTLVDDAGVSLLGRRDSRKRLTEVTEEEGDTVLEVDLVGVFRFTREALPRGCGGTGKTKSMSPRCSVVGPSAAPART